MAKQPLRAVLRLSSLSIPQKISKGQYINQQWGVYGATFPKTAPYTGAEMTAAVAELETAHTTAEGGGRLAHAEELAAEARFDVVFGAYRDWANQPDVAYNDGVKIEQLGLDLNREPQPTQRMGAPADVRLSGETEGELSASCQTDDGTRATIWFVALTADPDTAPADDAYRYCTASTRGRAVLPLKSGMIAWVRVLLVGPLGPGPLSAPVKRRVL